LLSLYGGFGLVGVTRNGEIAAGLSTTDLQHYLKSLCLDAFAA